MIHFTLVVIIVTQGAAPPPIQEQPIVQTDKPIVHERGPINWHCPDCGWWNVYDNMASFKIGSKAHLRGCPKR